MAWPTHVRAPARPPLPQRLRPPQGFTLIELLVVIAVIMLLAALAMPALMRAIALTERARCAGNMAQILRGCFLYANQFARYLPTGRPTRSGYGDDDLSRLYLGGYARDIKLFACPATEDNPTDEKHLRFKATEGGRLSYEYWGEYNPRLARRNTNPTYTTVLMDEDGYHVNGLIDGDNHGAEGGNMAFMDSRVQWLAPQAWLDARLRAGKEWGPIQ